MVVVTPRTASHRPLERRSASGRGGGGRGRSKGGRGRSRDGGRKAMRKSKGGGEESAMIGSQNQSQSQSQSSGLLSRRVMETHTAKSM